MTTKKFSQMTTKKLNALMATASEEDKKAIAEVLNAREQAQAAAAATDEEEKPLTAEEEAAIEFAEKNDGLNPLYNGSKAAQAKKTKLTDEELTSLAEELKANINHRCQAVPFNTVDWVDGYIAGIIKDKRNNKILYAIKTDDGRRIVKVHDSNLIRIFDEVVEPEKKARGTRKSKSETAKKPEWTEEEIVAAMNSASEQVGKAVKIEKYRTVNQETGEEVISYIEGRIVAIVADKRAQRLLYRISVPAPVEANPLAVKNMYRVIGADIQIAEEFDAEGEELNKKYRERRDAAAARTLATPQDRVAKCEEAVKKAEEKLQKATEELELKRKRLEEAKAELAAYLAEEPAAEAPAEEADPLA